MKISLKSFALGFGCAAIFLGAVTYANASSNSTIKACANKKTGAMRYIAKGACKKTERPLSWNQMGQQGLSGAPGAKGEPGAIGTAGTNGKNFHLIDSTGRDLGPVIGLWNQGQSATIIYEGGLWEISSWHSFPSGALSQFRFFSDDACTNSLAEVNQRMQSMARGWNGDEEKPKFWAMTGSPFLMSSRVVYGKIPTGSYPNTTYPCTPSTDSRFNGHFFEGPFQDRYLTALTTAIPPTYTAPFSIVMR